MLLPSGLHIFGLFVYVVNNSPKSDETGGEDWFWSLVETSMRWSAAAAAPAGAAATTPGPPDDAAMMEFEEATEDETLLPPPLALLLLTLDRDLVLMALPSKNAKALILGNFEGQKS